MTHDQVQSHQGYGFNVATHRHKTFLNFDAERFSYYNILHQLDQLNCFLSPTCVARVVEHLLVCVRVLPLHLPLLSPHAAAHIPNLQINKIKNIK